MVEGDIGNDDCLNSPDDCLGEILYLKRKSPMPGLEEGSLRLDMLPNTVIFHLLLKIGRF